KDKELAEHLGINLPEKICFWKNILETYRWLKYKNKARKETTNKDIKEVHKGKEIVNELNEQNQTIDSYSKKLALEIAKFGNMDEKTQKIVDQIKYTKNIAES
ncbi:24185_t:CDS:1, partial [Gigaspora margarita]